MKWYLTIVLICVSLMTNGEKAMAPHSSTLAWRIPWMEEPGGLQSMGSRRVGHDWATSLSLFTFMHWRRKWQPTPVFLPGESQGRRSLVGCRLWKRLSSEHSSVHLLVTAYYYVFFGDMFIQILCLLKNWIICLYYWVVRIPCIFGV